MARMIWVGGAGERGNSGVFTPTTAATRLRRQQRRLPDDDTAPVMADDRRLLDPERVEQSGEIADEVVDGVRLDRLRRVGLAVAALIRGDGAKAGLRQRPQLVAPRIPDLRKSMAQHHRESRCRPPRRAC